MQSDNHLAQAAQQSQKAALGSNQQLQGTAADLTQPLPADEAASAIETASANGAAAHLSQQLAAVQATATSIKALLGGSLDSIPAAAAKADEPAQVQAERPQKGSSLTEAVLLVTAARYAAKLCQELNTAVAQHATLHDRLTRADLPHAGLTGSFDLAQSQLTQAQAQVRGLIAHLKDAHVSAKEKELQLRNEISQTRHDLASQTAQLESSRAAIVSRDAEVANLQQQAAQLQQASQESEVSWLCCRTTMPSVLQADTQALAWLSCNNSHKQRHFASSVLCFLLVLLSPMHLPVSCTQPELALSTSFMSVFVASVRVSDICSCMQNMLEDRILRLGEGIEKMDTHVSCFSIVALLHSRRLLQSRFDVITITFDAAAATLDITHMNSGSAICTVL